jgi:hypothetical protein
VIRTGKIRWAEDVAHMEKLRNAKIRDETFGKYNHRW